MASLKLKKQIENSGGGGGHLILKKEESENNNKINSLILVKEGGGNKKEKDNNSKSVTHNSSSLLSSQIIPSYLTSSVASFNNKNFSVSDKLFDSTNNCSIPYCDNPSVFNNSSSSDAAFNTFPSLNLSSSHLSSFSTKLINSTLPEELIISSIPSNSSSKTFAKTSITSDSSPQNNSSSENSTLVCSSPSSTVTFVPRRRSRQHVSGIGGGCVRILGVHSEPGSFALDESPIEEEEELLIFGKDNNNIEENNEQHLEQQKTLNKRREDYLKGRRQLSAMSSLYRQATVSAAAASIFNSTATTVANALEFASNVEQQHPNVPPPPPSQNSRSQSPNNNSSGSLSDNNNNNSCSPVGNKAIKKLNKGAPNLKQYTTTSSEEGSLVDCSSPSISRTNSAQSIPIPSQKTGIDDEELSPYEKTIKMLSNDSQCQKELALDKRVGFYRLGKELGSGNFSKVKLGVHVLTKEKVAVKTMERGKMDQKAQRVLSREIDNMELLHHPNIIRLFEVVSTLSKVHLVMEYAGGGELYTYVHDNGKLSEEVAKPIFAQIVSAVAHLHSKQICHRDIKAENVFLSHPGWIKLGDFGFSCKYQEDCFLNTFCGSPPYAAPELFRDQKYIGPMVDIWAMGILLYFMLVGVTPFRGENVTDLKRNILEGVYYMPDYVSTFAQHSITRMLELDAKRRANILELKRTYWLSECKFPDSYVNLSLNPNEHSLSHCKLERLVWSQLQIYGINEEMLKSVAKNKGARNPIIGTYRITLYQCQAIDRDKERAKLNEHLLQLAEKNNLLAGRIDERSKACTLM